MEKTQSAAVAAEVESKTKWGFRRNHNLNFNTDITIRGIILKLMSNINKDDEREIIPLGHGDPSYFACFRTTPVAQDAVSDAIRSNKFNCYAPSGALPSARRFDLFFNLYY